MQNKSFTLIELLVVIALIGLLATIVMVSVGSVRAKARDARRKMDLDQLKQAIEMYYIDNGKYPPSSCGYGCNGYFLSYSTASWDAFYNYLKPYLATLPKDPINSGCPPWDTGCYSYTYGNVNVDSKETYDLTAQLESTSDPDRCEIKCWKWWGDGTPWCTACEGSYSNQIYEASTR